MNRDYCFIGGTPKSGTSSVFDNLSRLNSFCPSNPKETFYFMDSTNPLLNKVRNYHIDGKDGFNYYFSVNCSGKYLEATSHLLYQTQIIDEIKDLRPKIVFLLRSPENRVLSSFNYTKNNLGRVKKGLEFGLYVDILLYEKEDSLKKWITNPQSLYVLQRELSYSRYVKFLDVWKRSFQDEVKVMFYENMISSPNEFYSELCKFFEVPNDIKDTPLRKKNETFEMRNSQLHFVLSKIRDFGIFRHDVFQPLKTIYNKIQNKPMSAKIDTKAVNKLKEYYLPYNKELEKFLGCQLPW